MAIDIRFIFTVVLTVHGIGHLLGVISIVGGLIKSPDYTSNSWLLTDRLGLNETLVRVLGLLWLVPTAGFIAAAYGYWSDLEWWRSLTWVMIALSIGLFVVWWNAFASNIPIQANLGNIIAIVGLLWFA